MGLVLRRSGIQASGPRVSDFWVLGLGFKVWGLGLRV